MDDFSKVLGCLQVGKSGLLLRIRQRVADGADRGKVHLAKIFQVSRFVAADRKS